MELEIPVFLFADKLKKDGNENPAYQSIERIKKEFVSIAAAGVEEADRVRITNGSIYMNEYYNPDGSFVSYPRIRATFVSKVTDMNKFCPEATFSAVFMVGKMGYETDKSGVEIENRYKIRGVLPQYRGVDVIDFVAINPKVIDAVSSYWSPDDTVKINGKLNFSSKVVDKKIEVDFGEPRFEKHTITVSDLVITGGTQTPLEGDFAIDVDEARAALEERAAKLAVKKEEAANKSKHKTAPKGSGFSNLGF